MHARIKLQLGILNRRIKMNPHTNLSANPVKISGVMTNCLHKARLIHCHAYRVRNELKFGM